jgi:hypothetical protein
MERQRTNGHFSGKRPGWRQRESNRLHRLFEKFKATDYEDKHELADIMPANFCLRIGVPSCVAMLLSSCASVSVRDVDKRGSARPAQRPARIYVVPFSTENAVVKENFARKKRGQLPAEAQRILAESLAAELSKEIAPARVVKAGGVPARDGWIVSGRFVRIAEGNRLLRMGIGLGLGGTKMETEVSVRNLSVSNPPFLHFGTTGGSNAEPGAATSPIPFSAAPVALLQTRGGVTDDARRTSRMITATLGEYMVERGWIAPGRIQNPKAFRH